MTDKIILSICGAAGTGKSALANELTVKMGKDISCRIPTDYFLKSYSGVSYEEFIKTPFKYDWELLKKIISEPINHEITIPDYDFSKFNRISKTGGRDIILKRYIIIDSMLPYPESRISIRLTAKDELRYERIRKRDSAQNTNSARSWDKMTLTANLLDTGGYKYDMILDGAEKTQENAEKIFQFLTDKGMIG
jgi:uridine kinase